jgi:hypothetical protein
MEYLPEQLSEAEILEIVKASAAALGIEGGKNNMGRLIGAVMPKVKGKADGGTVKRIVESILD